MTRASELSGQSRPVVGAKLLQRVQLKPAQSLVLSFLLLILVGTVLLSLPVSWGEQPVRFIDAFFTAVSATCVTGLITVDTALAWSPFGKSVILALFQLGGIGMMSVAAVMAIALGRDLGIRDRVQLVDAYGEPSAHELRSLLRAVAGWTLALEGVGAVLLTLRFWSMMPLDRAAAHGVFHAVSAFCNAGFSLNATSLEAYAGDIVVLGTVALLVILGGLGFPVLVTLRRAWTRRTLRGMGLHARIVLISTGALLAAGAVAYFFFEFDHSLAHLSIGEKLGAAFFQSVTARTAGFNVVPMHGLSSVTVVGMCVLMFIGASPASTGGGIKTTSFVVLLLALRSYSREQVDIEVMGRRLGAPVVLRALALVSGAALTFIVGLSALLVLEGGPVDVLAFEVVSALATVGLSLGATPTLSVAGKVVVCILMFVGRVGPLTVVALVPHQWDGGSRVRYPEGNVMLG